jgi:hypothetical protein
MARRHGDLADELPLSSNPVEFDEAMGRLARRGVLAIPSSRDPQPLVEKLWANPKFLEVKSASGGAGLAWQLISLSYASAGSGKLRHFALENMKDMTRWLERLQKGPEKTVIKSNP